MQTAREHIKWRMHYWKLQYLKSSMRDESVVLGRSGSREGIGHNPDDGKWCEIPLSSRRPLLKGCLASLLSAAMWLHQHHTHTESLSHTKHTHALTYQRYCCCWGAPIPKWHCCRFFSISPSQWQKVTLRSPRDSASTRSRCTQRGGAPQHGRARPRGGGPALSFQWTTDMGCRKRERP